MEDMEVEYNVKDNSTKLYCLPWTDLRGMKHSNLVNLSKKSKKYANVDIEKPSPIFNAFTITDLEEYKNIFNIGQLDVKLASLRKLYAKNRKESFLSKANSSEHTNLPRYVFEVAKNIEQYEDCNYRFTGGVLDCVYFNDKTYIIWAGLKQPVHVVDRSEPDASMEINLNSESVVYGIKTASTENQIVLGVRQRNNISLFGLFDEGMSCSPVWNTDQTLQYSDIAINEFKNSEISVIDDNHNLIVRDYKVDKIITTNTFPIDSSFVNDRLGQAEYIDQNSLCFLNRSNIYLLDLRSSNLQKSYLKTAALDCDDLCAFSKNLNHNVLCIASKHNILKFDIRAWKLQDRTVHMLTTAPFISSLISYDDHEYVSIIGSDCKDKIIFYNTRDTLNSTQYVPNILDTYKDLRLTTKVKFSDYIKSRLALPNLGAKLYRDEATKKVSLYTINSVGDVFQQRLIKSKKNEIPNNMLRNWIDSLPEASKEYEVCGFFRMSHIMNSMSCNFPKKKYLKAYSNDNSAQFLEDQKSIIDEYSANGVSDVINEPWFVKKKDNC